MVSKRSILFTVTAALAVLVFAPVAAQAGPWTSPSGSAQDFDYANGGDVNGMFGDPLVFGNTLFFTGAAFQANAQNGGTATAADTVAFDISVHPGFTLSFVTVTAFGSYSLQGIGSKADANLGVSLQELTGGTRLWTGSLTTTPVTFPLEVTGPDLAGSWSGISEVDISFVLPLPESDLQISLDNILQSWAAAAGGAEINEQFQDIRFDFAFIPEPGTLGLLVFGGLVALRRRRR